MYLRYCAEACNEWRAPSPWLSAWTTQFRRKIAAVASLCPIWRAQESNLRSFAPLAMFFFLIWRSHLFAEYNKPVQELCPNWTGHVYRAKNVKCLNNLGWHFLRAVFQRLWNSEANSSTLHGNVTTQETIRKKVLFSFCRRLRSAGNE